MIDYSQKNRSQTNLAQYKEWKPRTSSFNRLTTFLKPALFTKSERKPLRPTAYLDGLRGFAAFLVYLGHHQSWSHENAPQGVVAENGFGYSDNYYFAAAPFFRIFFSGGHFAVCVFFIISGFVLSAKPLSLMTAKEHAKLSENVGSALFRRWFRLFLPVIGTTLTFATMQHVFDIWISWPTRQKTWMGEMWTWYLEFKQFSFLYKGGGDPWLSYNFHAWSIPVEMKGSIIIYAVCMAVSRCTIEARLFCEMFLMYYFMLIVDGWYCALFIAGMFLCDIEMLSKQNALPQWRVVAALKPYKELIFHNFLIVGVYLGGIPHVNTDILVLRQTPGWYYLSLIKPQAVFDYKWFYLFWAAFLTVSAINNLPWLRRFFELRFNLYLGRISFMFYLVHGPVMWGLGDRVYAATGWARELHPKGIPGWIDIMPLSKAGPFGMEFSYFVCQLILFPVTLWLSELAMKVFDEPSVEFAAWLYKRTLS